MVRYDEWARSKEGAIKAKIGYTEYALRNGPTRNSFRCGNKL